MKSVLMVYLGKEFAQACRVKMRVSADAQLKNLHVSILVAQARLAKVTKQPIHEFTHVCRRFLKAGKAGPGNIT